MHKKSNKVRINDIKIYKHLIKLEEIFYFLLKTKNKKKHFNQIKCGV